MQSDLHIPSTNISNLRNHQASHSAIVTVFERFANDPDILSGQPIIIYFAGLVVDGDAEGELPGLVPCDGKLGTEQALLPQGLLPLISRILEKKKSDVVGVARLVTQNCY